MSKHLLAVIAGSSAGPSLSLTERVGPVVAKGNTEWGPEPINGIAWTGSIFVAVGAAGRVATSSNGTTWTYQPGFRNAYPTQEIQQINWIGSKLVGFSGTASYTSLDNAVSWTQASGVLPGPAYLFLMIGSTLWGFGYGKAFKSTDGATWTDLSPALQAGGWGASAVLGHAASNGSVVLASGLFDGATMRTADGGTTWSYSTSAKTALSTASSLSALHWSPYASKFFAFASNACASSTDGITWTLTTSSIFPSTYLMAVYQVGNYLVAVGGDATTMRSLDGITWTSAGSLPSNWQSSRNRYVSGSGQTLAACELTYKGISTAITTDDAATWTAVSALSSYGWTRTHGSIQASAWLGSFYILGGRYGELATSSDGINWTYHHGLRTATWSVGVQSIANGGGLLVAVGGAPVILAKSSDSGVTWTKSSTTAFVGASYVNCVLYAGTQFVAIGDAAKVATSTDGLTWTARSLTGSWSTSYKGLALAWNGSVLLAVGQAAMAATSTDNGNTWTFQSGLSTLLGAVNVTSAIWASGQFIVGCASGKIATSPDGINWTYQGQVDANWNNSSYYIQSFATDGTNLLAASNGSNNGRSIAWSTNFGLSWTLYPVTSYANLVASNGTTFLATSVNSSYQYVATGDVL